MSFPDCLLFFYFSKYSKTENIAIKINNFEGTNLRVVNSQRIKHYISGNPINVETNVIETVTPKEYISDTFQNVSDSKKE